MTPVHKGLSLSQAEKKFEYACNNIMKNITLVMFLSNLICFSLPSTWWCTPLLQSYNKYDDVALRDAYLSDRQYIPWISIVTTEYTMVLEQKDQYQVLLILYLYQRGK